MVFDYIAKSGQERYVALADDLVRQAVRDLLRRRGGGPELLAYRDGRTWRDVSSTDINTYIKEKVGEDVSAKDFRTWHGTVIAAVALAEANEEARTKSARKRAVSQAMREVSEYLGNTPAVARKSYVDPRVVDLFHDGADHRPRPGQHRRRPRRRHHPRQDRARGPQPASAVRRETSAVGGRTPRSAWTGLAGARAPRGRMVAKRGVRPPTTRGS